ncbi:dihydrofolate reductase family protein [Paenarthrobacter nitroguajacolicus]|uniref:dihydrofolate reductase family protein n=1 Tax=Paenarthrobacter nitroguajacolicus TaxID=211146 RepID=UPI0021196488|nr:dihydrofolate reductase family protein [Paenarthrobacter nitroguajacolicus]
MAASLDGYIASENGDLSWLNDAMAKDEDYGFEATERRTGAYIMGANTFREVATWAAAFRSSAGSASGRSWNLWGAVITRPESSC